MDFLVELLDHDEVEPFLSARRRATATRCSRGSSARRASLRVRPLRDRGRRRRAGMMAFERREPRSRIARSAGSRSIRTFAGAGSPTRRRALFQRHLLEELGFHRLELEIYGFNERAIAHAERVGFVREGVKRKAYWRARRVGRRGLLGLPRIGHRRANPDGQRGLRGGSTSVDADRLTGCRWLERLRAGCRSSTAACCERRVLRAAGGSTRPAHRGRRSEWCRER